MGLRLRAHALARRIPALISRGLDAATLALFTDAQLDALTAHYYAHAPLYRDDTHNAALFDWEREAIDAHFPSSGHILITSAGGGREVLALANAHRQITASECVPSLVDELRRRAHGHAQIHLLPPDELPPGTFDAAIVGWTGYSHLPGRERRIAFLNKLSRALKPGAPLLLSYWCHDISRGALAVAAAANLFRRPFGARRVEPGESTALGFFVRNFAPGEVADEARAAGLVDAREQLSPYAHLLARAKLANFQGLR